MKDFGGDSRREELYWRRALVTRAWVAEVIKKADVEMALNEARDACFVEGILDRVLWTPRDLRTIYAEYPYESPLWHLLDREEKEAFGYQVVSVLARRVATLAAQEYRKNPLK